MINEDFYEEYCMEKLRLEAEVLELESKLESLNQEIEDVKSDLSFTQDVLDNLSEEDFVYD